MNRFEGASTCSVDALGQQVTLGACLARVRTVQGQLQFSFLLGCWSDIAVSNQIELDYVVPVSLIGGA